MKMATGEEVDDETLGGADMHSRISGVCPFFFFFFSPHLLISSLPRCLITLPRTKSLLSV